MEELDKPSYVSARMGYSFSFDKSGFSPLGIESAIEGAYFPNKRWGIGGEIGFGNYPMTDNEGWNDDMELDLSELGINNAKVTLQPIGLVSFMVGPQYAKKLSSKFILQAKAMTGLMIGPQGLLQVEGSIDDEGTLRPINFDLVEYKPRPSWVGGAGISLTGMVAPRIGINLFVDYKYANIPFNILAPKNLNLPQEELDEINSSAKSQLNNISTGLKLVAFF